MRPLLSTLSAVFGACEHTMLNSIITCRPPRYLLGGFLREAPAQYKKSSNGDVERAVMYVWVWRTSGT